MPSSQWVCAKLNTCFMLGRVSEQLLVIYQYSHMSISFVAGIAVAACRALPPHLSNTHACTHCAGARVPHHPLFTGAGSLVPCLRQTPSNDLASTHGRSAPPYPATEPNGRDSGGHLL